MDVMLQIIIWSLVALAALLSVVQIVLILLGKDDITPEVADSIARSSLDVSIRSMQTTTQMMLSQTMINPPQ